MPTIVRATVPATEVALAETFAALSTLEVEAERIVKSGEKVVMPLLWVRNTGVEEFESACADDPTIDDAELLADFDDELLYRMHWIEQVGLLLQMLTNGQATILNAFGTEEQWHLRMLYPSRDHLSETREFCIEHELEFTVDAIREMEGDPSGRYGLTTEQYEALVTAVRRGYFEVPRAINLEELADELGVSHQAVSECLRRGTEALIEDTLLVGFPEQETQSPSALESD
ncbi:helix-turn-helix domain-containing protein [Haloarcula nitratireducens]|uniref:Helix-turn-helix domain-containing protein n=1 Tax=Haloarcula nitratireducens TaxID=2487749 RepID=A0AAW4P8T3_9EURY|nr:helix-turn-helix domain-containing protein [Halomicroarcula nitratireducens]MBX0294329.1 helix-turn-helix domain-containing protein [Halomicroarcula nitratireducens]